MEAHTLGPCLPTNKRLSTTTANESEFYPSYLPSTSTLQQPCPSKQIVERAPKKQASEPPAETHWGKEKQRRWVGQAKGWLASTYEKTSVTSRQATNNVPAQHQTRCPRDAPQSPLLQWKPNQPEPKKKSPCYQ